MADVVFVSASFAQTTGLGHRGRVRRARQYLAGPDPVRHLETTSPKPAAATADQVPAGTARVTTFFTGLPPHTGSVPVAAGQIAQHSVTLGGADAKPEGGIVTLDEFRVETSREMDAAALAINEQRFASNIKNVVSTEEFGNVAEGNVAEFLKFLPGVTIDYTGGNARDISINGVPSTMRSRRWLRRRRAANLGTNRAVQSDMISINNRADRGVLFAHAGIPRIGAARLDQNGAARPFGARNRFLTPAPTC